MSIPTNFLVALSLSVLLPALGCGDDDSGPATPEPQPDAGVDTGADTAEADTGTGSQDSGVPDLSPPVQSEPAVVTVTVMPARALYPSGMQITPEVVVYDQLGEPMEVSAALTLDPPEAGILLESGAVELRQEGPLAIRACAPHPRSEDVCGQAHIMVDTRGPQLELFAPPSGSELSMAEGDVIEVRGRVTDTHGELTVYVNGTPAEVDDDGEFYATMAPRFGVNHVDVVAWDGLQRYPAHVAADVMWGVSYRQVETGGAVSFDDGAAVRLGQRFFDDGVRPVIGEESTEVETDDLADLLALVVARLDYMGQVPDPVVDGAGLTLRLTGITVPEPTIEVWVTSTGVEVFARIDGLRAQTVGGLDFEGTNLDLTGFVDATVSLDARIRLEKTGPDSGYQVEIQRVALAVEDADSQFGSAQANAVFDLAEGTLRTVVEDTFTDVIRATFVDQLPGILLAAISSIESALDSQSISLDIGTTSPVTLSLGASMASLTPTARDEVRGTMAVSLSTDQPERHPHSRGVIMSVDDEAVDPFLDRSPMQIAVRLALLNGLFHTVWNSGFLDIDVTGLLPENMAALLQQAEIAAQLPPVMTLAEPGMPHQFMVVLGQVELTMSLLAQVDTYGFNVAVGADLLFVDNGIEVVLSEEPRLIIWQISTTGGSYFFDAPTLETLVMTQVWPMLDQSLASNLSFALPVIDLSAIGAVAPDLGDLQLSFAQQRPLDLRDGYVVFDGAMVGTTARQ